MAYKPGDFVPCSGIYKVVHEGPKHRLTHDVTCIEGRRFPPCKTCEHPEFVLRYQAIHVNDHAAFS
jgi:hypothetical protein